MDQDELTALIKRAQGGDKAAFEQLLQEHYEIMYKIAFQWSGHRENAQDITQEACIKLARSIDSFSFQSKFTSWLYRLVINTAHDFYRGQIKHKQPVPEQSVAGQGADEALYAREVFELVCALPEKEKDAILLVCAQGHTHAQAAEIMNVKESTVSWYIHEGRKKLASAQGKEAQHG
jgi:RNA polymerase sigma-70 factor (ECF subfamily)